MFLFKGIQVIQSKGLGSGDIDGIAQEIGQSGGCRAHHLIHDLAHSADRQFVKLKLLVGGLAAHQDVHDHLYVVALEQHNVAALQAGDILDLNADSRFQIPQAEVLNRNHAHRGGGNIHPMVQHIGYGGGGGPQADVHEFTDGIQLHGIKDVLTHVPYFSSLLWMRKVSPILTAILPPWVPSLPLNQG